MAESLPGTRHLKNDASATNGSRSVAIVSEGRQPREIHVADLRRREGPRRYRAGAMLREVYGARARLASAGQYLAAAPLHPTSSAMSVRVRESKRLVTDGPFAETREQLGGYFLVEAKNIDEAIDIATRIPMARLGTVEVRPVIEIPGLPKS